jgi:acetolactate synthase I/II/III large subunit
VDKPVEPQLQAAGNFWKEYGADEWTDAVVAAMKLGGVDHLFFVSGTELAYFQEAIVKAGVKGWPAPKLVTMIHESAALHAAIGAATVSGRPTAAAAHVDVGTLHYGAAIHTAWRANAPVLITAGNAPRSFPGSMPGSRNSPVQWVQEPRDQGEIMRQYTKADHRMEYQDNPGMMVSRLLQLAMSEPRGPVYLSMPREIAMLPCPGVTRFPTRDQLGLARPTSPDPDDARTIARWLVKAENPCLFTARLGHDHAAVAELVRLAELLALPVAEAAASNALNFPNTHPLYGTAPRAKDVDVALVLESIRPWSPDAEDSPGAEAKIAWISVDPVQSRFKTMEFRADLWIPASCASTLRAVHEAATGMLDRSDLSRIADRRKRYEQRRREMEALEESKALEAGRQARPDTRWVSYELGKLLQPDSIILNDVTSTSAYMQHYLRREKPGTFFRSGTSTGGWGPGAALGAKLVSPNQDVVLTSGDGFYIFGEPLAALWSARHLNAPYLSVIIVNASFSTGTTNVQATYPNGYAVKHNQYPGGLFDPPPNFAKLAESVDCYGEYIHDTADVGPALKRGLEQVRNGMPAVVAVRVPNLV